MSGHTHDAGTVWIRTEPTDSGGYVVVLSAGDDVAVTMDRDRVMNYAHELLRAVAIAEYDAAVFAQVTRGLSLPKAAAAEVVRTLRADRPPLDDRATEPFVFEPGVSRRSSKGFLQIVLGGQTLGQWELADAREHVLTILEAYAVADLDSAYQRALVGVIGIEPGRAQAVIEDLVNFR
jgi:hypothetical protein